MLSAQPLARGILALFLTSAPAVAQYELYALNAPDGFAGDLFGASLDIDRGRLLVGAPDASGSGGALNGAAYLFDITTGARLHKLIANTTGWDPKYGWSVSLDGNLAVIGAPRDNPHGTIAGAAFIFDLTTGAQLHKLSSAGGSYQDSYGRSVSISGSLAIVGVPWDDDQGTNSGSAYVFDAITGQELHKLLPSDGAPNGVFGNSVCIFGNRVVVSRAGGGNADVAAAYVFDPTTGQQLLKLVPWDFPHGWFGYPVHLNREYLLVGSQHDNSHGYGYGSAYVFTATTGTPIRKIRPWSSPSGGFADALAMEGSLGLIGAGMGYAGGPIHSGAAYLCDLLTGQELLKVMAPNPGPDEYFGRSVAYDGDYAAVGHFVTPWHFGTVHVFDMREPGQRFCLGDPGSGTPCPCGNDNDGKLSGSGCANGSFSEGARLQGAGRASISDDTLVLRTALAEPMSGGMYFQGENDLSPGVVWGDGLRCVGGNELRLEVQYANELGRSRTTGPLSAAGGVVAGDTVHYQFWYRSTIDPPCGAGVYDFNTTNGYSVTWRP